MAIHSVNQSILYNYKTAEEFVSQHRNVTTTVKIWTVNWITNMFTKLLLGTLKHHLKISFCAKCSFFKVPEKYHFDTLTLPEEINYTFTLHA